MASQPVAAGGSVNLNVPATGGALAYQWSKNGVPVAGAAIRADAESRAAQLDYAGALDRLKAAQGLMRSNKANADYVEGSIIDTRARQIALILKEQALQDKIDR